MLMQAALQQELSLQKAELHDVRASLAEIQQDDVQRQAAAVATEADLHTITAALADLICTAQSSTAMLQQLQTTSQIPPPVLPSSMHSSITCSHPEQASEGYLPQEAASAKEGLERSCQQALAMMEAAQEGRLRLGHQMEQTKSCLQQANHALRNFVLPSLSAGSEAMQRLHEKPAGLTLEMEAESLTELTQQAVMASASMASHLTAAVGRADGLQAAQDELQGVQAELRSELQHEQVQTSTPVHAYIQLQTPRGVIFVVMSA